MHAEDIQMVRFLALEHSRRNSVATTFAAKSKVQGMPALRFIGLGGKIAATCVGLVSVEALLKQLEALTVAAIQ